ncbi:MAG: hypothetical protein HY551_03375 [Elusimicrobia bacterium]|nr:hypothetical protein [Elusimicrobiota bacterium]
METERCRLRMRLETGAELEVEGSPELIREERRAFLAGRRGSAEPEEIPLGAPNGGPGVEPGRESAAPEGSPEYPQTPPSSSRHHPPRWEPVVESQGSSIQLRAKLDKDKTEKDASLVLLAAAQNVLNLHRPTAAQLARWLRASGYPVQRVDRAISEAISHGDILVSGSRRARRYELTGPGRVKAYYLAKELSDRIRAS